MEKKELVVGNITQLEGSPAETIRLGIEKGVDLDKMAKALEIQERFEAMQAKKAYVKAMADFKSNAPLVDKDKVNNQYKSKYTSLGHLINTVSPVLSKYGLSASWDIEQNGIIKVTCKMTHELGHSECATAQAPADTSGAKNVIQQIKSTITYLKAVTFESICGLASTDANVDDDGNCVGAMFITDEQKSELVDMATELKVDMPAFCNYLKVESLDKLPAEKFIVAKMALETKANQQKAAKKEKVAK